MRWFPPWHRHRPTGGALALEAAERALREAEARRPEVHAVAGRLRESRQANHFGESIAHAMRGRA